MTTPTAATCPYDRRRLFALPIATSVTVVVHDQRVPVVVWLQCGRCRSTVAIPLTVGDVEDGA